MNDTASRLIGEFRARAERVISWVRLCFCVIVLARFGRITDLPSSIVVLTAIPIAASALLSLYLLGRPRRPVSEAWLVTSVALDATVCVAVQLHHALFPSGAWIGIASMPDTATLLIVMIAGGLRLSRSAALVAVVMNSAGFALLVAIDRSPEHARFANGPLGLSMYAVLLASAAALTLLVATRTRSLVEQTAQAAARAARTRLALSSLLTDHHHLRSLLGSATLNTDLLLAASASTEDQVGSRARELREDLAEVNAIVGTISEQALTELLMESAPSGAPVVSAAREVVRALSGTHSHVALSLRAPEGADLLARISGGRRGLQRVLWNLIDNACQGRDGRGASRVRVEIAEDAERVRISVDDDGPGFDPVTLSEPPGAHPSTKPKGGGIGLMLSSRLVGASGGTLVRENPSGGGARVVVSLPRDRHSAAVSTANSEQLV